MRGNVISGNTGTGLDIRGETSSNNAAEGNFLGIDSSGSRRLANQIGVAIREGATLNTIGGSSLSTYNIISGNTLEGIDIEGIDSPRQTNANSVSGNYIGTDYSGTFALPNAIGVLLWKGAASNEVSFNFISGNTSSGVDIEGADTSNNVVRNNFIGLAGHGSGAIANGTGVQIGSGAHGNTIGGTLGNDNVISGNAGAGVLIAGSQPLKFANGFDSIAGQLTLNGTAQTKNATLQLTDGEKFEAAERVSPRPASTSLHSPLTSHSRSPRATHPPRLMASPSASSPSPRRLWAARAVISGIRGSARASPSSSTSTIMRAKPIAPQASTRTASLRSCRRPTCRL